MRKTLRLGVAALAAAALVAGCGGDDDDGDSGSASTATTTEAPAQAANTVGMKDIQFDPKAITVKVGDTVTWTNNESVPHDVKATSGADFASETFGKGGTYKFTTEEAGEIEYVCTLHPGMEGTITVTD